MLSDAPEAPRSLEIVDVSRTGIVLQWEIPRHDGGAPVTGYVLERAQAYSNRFLRLAHLLSAGETTHGDVNVHDGYEYEYRVCAENEAGEGPFSNVVGPIAARDRFGTHLHSLITDHFVVRLMQSVTVSVCLSVTFVSPAKTAEPIEMPFGELIPVSPRNHALDGGCRSPRRNGNFGVIRSIERH